MELIDIIVQYCIGITGLVHQGSTVRECSDSNHVPRRQCDGSVLHRHTKWFMGPHETVNQQSREASSYNTHTHMYASTYTNTHTHRQ